MAIDIMLDQDWLVGSELEVDASQPMSEADALVRSIRDRHCVDMPYIAHLTCQSEEVVSTALGSAVFLDPET